MGFYRGGFALRRIQVSIPSLPTIPSGRMSYIVSALNKFPFSGIMNSTERASLGWVTLLDPDSSKFSESHFLKDYLAFSFRKDQRKLPASILRSALKVEEFAWLEQHQDVRRVPKQVRSEIRERVEMSLYARILPSPSVTDLLWNTTTGELYLFTNSASLLDEISELFKRTFPESSFALLAPFAWSTGLINDTRLEKLNQTASGSPLDLINSNQWVGRDFLTWLVHQNLTDPKDSFWLEGRTVLKGNIDLPTSTTLSSPNELELRAALRERKEFSLLSVVFMDQDVEWKVTVDARTFAFSGCKLPSVALEHDDDDTEQAYLFERIFLFEKLLALFSSSLREFLSLRIDSAAWNNYMKDVSNWVLVGSEE